jgi:hypothetical protein
LELPAVLPPVPALPAVTPPFEPPSSLQATAAMQTPNEMTTA